MTDTQEPHVTNVSSPLKWAGGKRWLVPRLRQIWLKHAQRRFIEPFVGGMAISLGLRPTNALLNDTNPHLINFYRWVQLGLKMTIKMENDKDLYYEYRKRFNDLTMNGAQQSAEAAQLFYYLNRTCFNGLCRFNKKGEFNVPFGKYRKINYASDLSLYKEILSSWVLVDGDVAELHVKPDDFLYVDPPYDVEFTSYSPGGFSWEDQVRLVEWLSHHRGPVVASNQATDRILNLYKQHGFKTETIPAPRFISCDGNRASADEMLAVRGM